MGHIRIGHSTEQMIKSKSYIGINEYHNLVKFDSDYLPIEMDTGASCVMPMKINDFIELDKYKETINNLGAIKVKGKGKIWWPILNDKSEQVELVIKDALYAARLPIRFYNQLQILTQQNY